MKVKINETWKSRLYLIGLFMSLPTITGLVVLTFHLLT